LRTIPAADMTFATLPPHPGCFVSGSSLNDWYTSKVSPHFEQR
jgi:hypothetical protein